MIVLQHPFSVFSLLFTLSLATPLLHRTKDHIEMADKVKKTNLIYDKVYLQNFCLLDKTCTNHSRRRGSYLTERLKQIQAFFSLSITGHLDALTIDIMKTPRCGVPDVKQFRVMNQQVHWLKKALTYSIVTYTSQLPSATVNHLISSALKVWSDVSPLTFIPSSPGKADIIIRFTRRAHGDSQPFDGPGGTVAHAFGPGVGIGGDVHFDGDEKWSAEHNGINLYLVAAHEFGHSLGLLHSRNPASLMYPTYQKRTLQGSPLSFEDVHKIQTLYGPKPSSGRTRHSYIYQYLNYFFPKQLSVDDKCDVSLTFDAVTSFGENIIFFKNRKMWIKDLSTSQVKEGFIKNFLSQIKANISAAYEVSSTKTIYIFQGSRFWTIRNLKMKRNPSTIYTLGLPHNISHVDAALHIKETGKTLLFFEENCWSYDESTHTMDKDYPKNISYAFPGISGKVDAAFEMAGFLHFIIDFKSYKYDYKSHIIVDVFDVGTWLGC